MFETKGIGYLMLIPWRKIRFWECTRCGSCCQSYIIPLKLGEAIFLAKNYPNSVVSVGNRFCIRKINGRCVFLGRGINSTVCSIYLSRPRCCRLFPFHFFSEPRLGLSGEDALFFFRGKKFYAYINDECRGVGKGYETENILDRMIKIWLQYETVEFIESLNMSPTLTLRQMP
jgi:Fe-S-cluster containining protein